MFDLLLFQAFTFNLQKIKKKNVFIKAKIFHQFSMKFLKSKLNFNSNLYWYIVKQLLQEYCNIRLMAICYRLH